MQSVIVFSTVLCLNYRFVFMGDYLVYMSGNPANDFGSIISGPSGNTQTPSTPPGSSGPSTTNITDSSPTRKPIIRLVYCQCYDKGDYLSIVSETDRQLLESIRRDELVSCEIRQFELRKRYLLDLDKFEDKRREINGKFVGISIPCRALSDSFDYRQANNVKIPQVDGRFFIRISEGQKKYLNISK